MSTIDEKLKALLDAPEPSLDFNNRTAEHSINKHSAQYKNEKPAPTEFFRCYDPSGRGELESIKRRGQIELPIKGIATRFLCLGSDDFLKQVQHDIGKITMIRPAMFETSNGRVGIWPVKEAVEYANGNKNAWNASAETICQTSLTKWVRMVSNNENGYYDGYMADQRKVDLYLEQGRPFFKEDYDTVLTKAYQGFILTEANYESDPHVADFVGDRIQQDVRNEKGQKIN
tara:strand:+ start:63 stop:752 length:690 start_codon:yes stop_codon:yes gene_type:complete